MVNGFVNPYNFIQFPERKAKAYTDKDKHTGYIEYTVTTKTPLFIPNSSSDTAFCESDKNVSDEGKNVYSKGADKKQYHKSYDFFSYTDLDPLKHYEDEYHMPVIPGSEMRGVVRNAYETLTDACMGVLNEDTHPIKRSAECFKPALLYRDAQGKMELCAARSLRIDPLAERNSNPKGFESCHNGAKIYYCNPPKNDKGQPETITMYSFTKGSHKWCGYLLKWGMGVKKKRYHVFSINQNGESPEIKVSKDVVKRKLLPVLESYLSQPGIKAYNERAYKEYKQDLTDFLDEKKEAYFPVMYSKLGNGIFYLAPACFSKEISNHNIGELAGEFRPCEGNFCPACDLFGYIAGGSKEAKGSRIRFTDLYVVNNDQVTEQEQIKKYYLEENHGKVTLQTLGEPKLGNVDFYLKRPYGASFWTYDYYINHGKTRVEGGQLRGRKYYWHHRNVDTTGQNTDITKLNKTIRPIKSDVEFKGKLYFESISEKQLQQLIWLLNSSKQGEGRTLGLKLGSAKPLGYGSVTCSVTSVEERKLTIEDGLVNYRMMPYLFEHISYENVGFSDKVKNEFFTIADIAAVPKNIEITYPKTKEQMGKLLTEGYLWFGCNHGTVSGKVMPKNRADVLIKNVLPFITESGLSLPYYENTDKKHGEKKGSWSNKNSNGGKRNCHKAYSHSSLGNRHRQDGDRRDDYRDQRKGY